MENIEAIYFLNMVALVLGISNTYSICLIFRKLNKRSGSDKNSNQTTNMKD
jgi:hypothetical protein